MFFLAVCMAIEFNFVKYCEQICTSRQTPFIFVTEIDCGVTIYH